MCVCWTEGGPEMEVLCSRSGAWDRWFWFVVVGSSIEVFGSDIVQVTVLLLVFDAG